MSTLQVALQIKLVSGTRRFWGVVGMIEVLAGEASAIRIEEPGRRRYAANFARFCSRRALELWNSYCGCEPIPRNSVDCTTCAHEGKHFCSNAKASADIICY